MVIFIFEVFELFFIFLNLFFFVSTCILQEVIGTSKLRSILKERDLRVFWGIATASKLDVSYFGQIKKLSDFLKAGCHVGPCVFQLHLTKSLWTHLHTPDVCTALLNAK